MSFPHEVGSASMRSQLGIKSEDPRIFRPVTMREALAAAKTVARDECIDSWMAGILCVGLPLDLMPSHLTPRKQDLAAALGVSVRTVRRREIDWECHPRQDTRWLLVHRAFRLIVARRGAAQ